MTDTLRTYRVDRADGYNTAEGIGMVVPEKLVIINLVTNEHPQREISVAMSKMDAMLIALQLSNAAAEVQAEKLG